MIVWTAVWLELPLQLSLTKDQLAEHMFFSTGFKLNLWFTLKATRAGVITTNVEYKRLFFSLFPLDVGSTGMKSATIRQHFSISMCKGCHVLCFQGRAQTTANIGMGYDTHARTDTCAHIHTHRATGLRGKAVPNSWGRNNNGSRRDLCLCSAH